MTKLAIMKEWFAKYDTDYLKFDFIEKKFSTRADIHAFILLDNLVPGICDIIYDSNHEYVILNINIEVLAEVITEDQVRDLRRCGITLDDEGERLAILN